MSTKIKTGAEYARILESTGMAYELSPLLLVEKAFEEGADSVKEQRDGALETLNSVRAELAALRRDKERFIFALTKLSAWEFNMLPEDIGQAREFIDSRMAHAAMKGGVS